MLNLSKIMSPKFRYGREGKPHWVGEPSPYTRKFYKILKKEGISGKIIDLGCGEGEDARFLAEKGLDVIGIDSDQKAIENARARAKKEDISIKFKVGDAENLPYGDETFEGAVSLWALQFTDLKKSINELYRILKKEGIAIITLFEKTKMLETGKVKQKYSESEVTSLLKSKFEIIERKKYKQIDKKPESHEHVCLYYLIKKSNNTLIR